MFLMVLLNKYTFSLTSLFAKTPLPQKLTYCFSDISMFAFDNAKLPVHMEMIIKYEVEFCISYLTMAVFL